MITEDTPTNVMLIIIIYMIIRDVVGPTMKKMIGTKDNDVDVSIKVIEIRLDHMEKTLSEIKEQLKSRNEN